MSSCGKIFVLAKIVTFHAILFIITAQNSVQPSPQNLSKMFAAILPVLSLEGK